MKVEEACAFEVVRYEGCVGGVVVGETAEEEERKEGVLVGVGCIGFRLEGVLVRGKVEVGMEGKSEVLWSGGIRSDYETFLRLQALCRELVTQEYGDMLGSRKGEVS